MVSPPHMRAQPEEPPEPPSMERRFVIRWPQGLGLLVLFSIPVLALFGVFGEKPVSREIAASGFVLRAEYAPRARHGMSTQIKIMLERPGPAAVGRVRIELDSNYLDRFSKLSMLPQPDLISSAHYSFDFAARPDSEHPQIVIDLEPERYGSASGWVRAFTETGATLELPLSTFIFP